MILDHLREVRALSDDLVLRERRIRNGVKGFGQALHAHFGPVRLLLGGFAAGFVFDRLRPRWPTVRSTGALGLSLLRLAPLPDLAARTVGRDSDAG